MVEIATCQLIPQLIAEIREATGRSGGFVGYAYQTLFRELERLSLDGLMDLRSAIHELRSDQPPAAERARRMLLLAAADLSEDKAEFLREAERIYLDAGR
jgi:hypothetical protein